MTERSNEAWIAALSQPGPAREIALADLRARLVRGLGYALADRPAVTEADREDFVQEALLKILAGLPSFRGEARFTTWAQKIAVRVAFSELRRRRWRDVSLEAIIDRPDGEFIPESLADPSPDSEQQATQHIILDAMRRAIAEELTDRQRQALTAVGIRGMPIEEVAQRMDTNRNALYKLLHDARKRLKQAMEDTGLSPEDILSAFD